MTVKISLQDVVNTVCDALADLSPDDQTRALEAARLTLGLELGLGEPVAPASWSSPVPERAPRLMMPPALPQEAHGALLREEVDAETELSSPLCDPSMFQEKPVKRLPTVVIQMMGDRPMVVGQQVGRPGRTLAGPQRQPTPAQAPQRGGFVLRRR